MIEPKFVKYGIEIYPSLKQVQHVYDYRNTQFIPDRPQFLPCDFCGRDSDRLFCWPTYPFGVEYMPQTRVINEPAGDWCACVFCRPLFEWQDFGSLAARSRTLVGADMPHEGFERMHRAVYSAIAGPMWEWHAGQLRPGKR